MSILPGGIPSEDQIEALVVKESAPTPEVIKAMLPGSYQIGRK